MADNELTFTADADPRVTDALRARYAAPRDPAYWEGLQARVMARVGGNGRGAWWQVAAGWARPGLAAAAAILVFATAAMLRSGDEVNETAAFQALASDQASQPEFIYTEQDAASQREETLRLVVSHY